MSDLYDKLANNLSDFKYHTLIAGFFGAVVYVMFTKNLSRAQVFTSVLIGLLTAYYLTPLVIHYSIKFTSYKSPSDMEGGVGFLIGLLALYIIPALIRKINKVGQ